jgi:DNA-binding response OmpR family regulator
MQKIGRLLMDRGLLTEEAFAAEFVHGDVSENEFLSRLLAEGVGLEGELALVLAERYGQPAVDLSSSSIFLDVLDLIPRSVAEQDQLLPLSTDGDRLHVAVPSLAAGEQSVDEVRFITGREISLYLALADPLRQAIAGAYDARERGERIWSGAQVAPDAPIGLALLEPVGLSPLSMKVELARSLAAPAAPYSTGPLAEEEIPEAAVVEDDDVSVVEEPTGEVQSLRATPPRGARQPAPLPSADVEVEVGGGDDGELVASVSTAPKRILVVDDDPEILKLCSRALASKGWEVQTAADGAEAELRLRVERPPDLVLLDAMLPHVNGFEICQRLKASRAQRHIPVVMMSAMYSGWRFAQDVREAYGADDFVEKPFQLADLLRRVEERLAAGSAEPPKRSPASEKAYQEGVAALDDGRVQDARAALERAVKEDPFSARAHFALARAFNELGETFRAISAYEKAIDLRPGLFPALKSLAALYLEKGFRRKAAETLERALHVAPDPQVREKVKAQLLKLL